ncbi:MAG TPA: electron transport complex subunit RsxB [Burkholderiaceae bacterium]|nr:electron transport complex subunit RsxB [Burkholderiaceae bacterium]
MNASGLVQALDDALPQTQCTRCGYPDCRSYAQAIVAGEAEINQCPPGGDAGIVRLAALTGRPALPLSPAHGTEAPRQLAVIDETWCIGCTLCLKACPVDCIVGGPKAMHTVIDAQCTGCELCLPACPVDCIALVPATGTRTGWNAWSAAQADEARTRHAWHRSRLERDARAQLQRLAAGGHAAASSAAGAPAKRSVVEAALARARAARAA